MVITTHLMALAALLLTPSHHPLTLEATLILTMMKPSLSAQTEVSFSFLSLILLK